LVYGLPPPERPEYEALLRGRYDIEMKAVAGCTVSEKESSVDAKKKMSSIGQPVPELPVAGVERGQQHYRDALGFEIGRLYPGKEIGAVSRGEVAIFFRKKNPPFEPDVHWVFADRTPVCDRNYFCT
jgi:hypothetical protein